MAACHGDKKGQSTESGEGHASTPVVAIDAIGAPVREAETGIVQVEPSGPTVLLLWSWGGKADVLGTLQGLSFRPDHEIPQAELAGLVASGKTYSTTAGAEQQAYLPAKMLWGCVHYEIRKLPTHQKDLLVVGSTWPLRPRDVKELKIGPTIKSAAREALEAMGASSELAIQGANAVDLDGDGKNEYLLSVSDSKRVMHKGKEPRKGDFSGFLVLPGDPSMTPGWMGEIMKDEDPWFANYQLSAVADLDGDSTLEIVVHGKRPEGSSVEILSYSGTELVSIAALHWGKCSKEPYEAWGEP